MCDFGGKTASKYLHVDMHILSKHFRECPSKVKLNFVKM